MSEKPQPANPGWDGKYPVVGLKIVKDFDRPPAEHLEPFSRFFLPDVSDLVGVMYTMISEIRPAYQPMRRLIGPAYTVKVPPGDNLMLKKAVHMANPGDVIVVDARGHTSWCLGGAGMCVTAKSRGVAGMVLDGAYRDMEQIQNIDFPMHLKAVSAATGPKRGPGEINVPVSCGGVVVYPGDIIMADREGVVVIPRHKAAKVIELAEKVPVKMKEEDWDWETAVTGDLPRVGYYDALLEQRGLEVIER